MRRRSLLLTTLSLIAAMGPVFGESTTGAFGQAPASEAITFRVERSRESRQVQNDFRTREEARIEYRIQVTERRGPGDLSLRVTFGSFAIEHADGHGRRAFDSSWPEAAGGNGPMRDHASDHCPGLWRHFLRSGRPPRQVPFDPKLL